MVLRKIFVGMALFRDGGYLFGIAYQSSHRDSKPHSGGRGTGGSAMGRIRRHHVIRGITSIGFYLILSNHVIT